MATLDDHITDALYRAARSREHAALAGVDMVPEVYDEVIQSLRAGLAAAQRMRSHSHAWDDRGFCEVCGADGNA